MYIFRKIIVFNVCLGKWQI